MSLHRYLGHYTGAAGPSAVSVGGAFGLELGFEGAVVPTALVGGELGVELGFAGAVAVVPPVVEVGGDFGVEVGFTGQILVGRVIAGELGFELGFAGAVQGDVDLAGGALGFELGFAGTVLPQLVLLPGGELGIELGFAGVLLSGRLLGGAFGIELGMRDRYSGPGTGLQVDQRPTDLLGKLRYRQRSVNAMREGDWRPLLLPWVELDDVVGRGVVLARTARDDREEQQLEWQVIRDSEPGVTAALRTGEALRHRPAEHDDLAREVVRQRAERERIRRR